MRRRILATCLCLAAATASAQGVPTEDVPALGRLAALLSRLGEDTRAQRDALGARERLAAVRAEQLQVLEAMTTAMTNSSFDAAAFEALPGAPAAEVYAAGHPMETRLFGEGRETVERMIVRAASETAGAPGVRRAGLSPSQWRFLFQALVKQESRFSVAAQSPVGAYGLTQLMPGTAADLGVNRYDAMDNLRGGARYLAQQLGRFGVVAHALAAYNAGPGRVIQYGGVPPFRETQGYVRNITRFYQGYLAASGSAETLGTLSAADETLAEHGAIAEASALYAEDAHAAARRAVDRIAALVKAIDGTHNARSAADLNAYARAELARLASMRLALMTTRAQRLGAAAQQSLTDRHAESRFKPMTVSP